MTVKPVKADSPLPPESHSLLSRFLSSEELRVALRCFRRWQIGDTWLQSLLEGVLLKSH